LVGQATTPSSIANPPNLTFGSWANSSGRYFNGKLDEVQISSTVRTSDWITTSYNNQSSPSTFYTVGRETMLLVTPGSAALYASETQQFQTYLTGACATSVTWSSTPAGLGTVTSNGLYTAPSSITAEQSVLITATDTASQASGSAVVTLLPVANPTLAIAASI